MLRAPCGSIPQSRWFLPLMAASGVTMSLTAPLEVLFVREFSRSGTYIGIFMLSAAIGVIVVDVFGSRFVPGVDARAALTVGLCLFGVACIGMGLASGGDPADDVAGPAGSWWRDGARRRTAGRRAGATG